MRILIADDDSASLVMLEHFIGRWNHEAVLAENGLEAWELLRSAESPLIAILDREMPGFSGIELCHKLRGLDLEIPHYIILLTGKNQKPEIVEGLEAGANDYVTKPYHSDELRARIAVGCRVVELQQALVNRVREIEEFQKREEGLRKKVEALGGWLGSRVAVYSGHLPSLSHLAEEVAQAIGVGEIRVYVRQDNGIVLLTDKDGTAPGISPPLLESVISSGEQIQIPGSILIPMRAASGLILGAVTVHGIVGEGLVREELKMVSLFGREIASGLELRWLRRDLEKTRLARQKEQRNRDMAEGERLAVCPGCDRCFGDHTSSCPQDGSDLQVLPDVPYLVSGRYRFELRLGTGGMGMVFRALDTQLSRKVALKLVRLRPTHMDSMTNRLRFEAEAQILARLNHPAIVTLFDSGELPSGTRYLVTEVLNGLDLDQMISLHGPGTPGQVASLARQAGEALQAAHNMGLVHRDIKPANFFVLADMAGVHVKLIDFGLARSEGSVRVTRENMFVGTPRYLAPEVFRMGETGPRSDLYSLATVVYEALTGTPAVTSERIADIVLEVLEQTPKAVSTLLGPGARPLDDLFRIGMAKRPEIRPAAVQEWVTEIARQLDALPSTVMGWTGLEPVSPGV